MAVDRIHADCYCITMARAKRKAKLEPKEHLIPIGARLRKWRDSHGFSLSVAADQLKAAAASWRSWEIGEKAPELHFAFAVESLTSGSDDPILASDWAFPRKTSKASEPTDDSAGG